MKTLLKWLGILVGIVILVIIIAVAAIYITSNSRINTTYNIQPDPVTIPTDEASIAEGERLVITRGCIDCHGENLGGTVFTDSPPTGTIYGSNLTSGAGGIGTVYSDADWVRAIRHGIEPDGKPLIFMPSYEYYFINDDDLGKMIAYMKQVSPVNKQWPESSPGPLFRVLMLTGELPLLSVELIDHDAPRAGAVTPGPSVEYGEYLAKGCIGCHGENLGGGPIAGGDPSWPPAANLTSDPDGLGNWTAEDFERAMRQGIRPDGSAVNPVMPWPNFAQMTDDEITALWLYLQTVPAASSAG